MNPIIRDQATSILRLLPAEDRSDFNRECREWVDQRLGGAM